MSVPMPPASASVLNTTAAVSTPALVTSNVAWWREPLLHFVLLGAALFAADLYLTGGRDDPRTIVVGAEVDQQARETFKSARGREPDGNELTALRQVWLDNEVLYREGLAMQVDKGDSAIRERVIFKALSMVEANLTLPKIDDAGLRAWFEDHRAKYDDPQRFDFQEAVLVGDNSEAAVRAFVAALEAGTPGDAKAGLRVFKGRPLANLVQSYGEAFAKALQDAPVGQWRAQPTREGWRAIRVEAVSGAKPAEFDALRGVVLQDWTDATMAALRTDAVRSLARKYKVRTATADGASR